MRKQHLGLIFCAALIFIVLGCRSTHGAMDVSSSDPFDMIDVSRHQGRINWKKVASEKRVRYVYLKATEGGTYQDPNYEYNLKQARKNGLKVGTYHFFRTSSSVWLQFLNIMTHVPKKKQDLVPVIDVEECKNWSGEQLRDSLSLLARLIEIEYGQKPIIYSGQNFYNRYLKQRFEAYPLWIARYGSVPPMLNVMPVVWQFTERGRVKGISTSVDLNRVNPALEDLLVL
ncbi:MAG: glycosyl hydrolase family 25 [Bacteroidaceae bacterium]|nr:glycosyl hydrolase family 25 [Bacteroidaceae bacterium]